MKKTFMFSIFVFLFFLPFGMGSDSPAFFLPNVFYGEVLVNGVPASDGYVVQALINGSSVAETVTKNGSYGEYEVFLIENEGYTGKLIEFYVGGINTGESYIFSSEDTIKKIDLSIVTKTTAVQSSSNSHSSYSSYDSIVDYTNVTEVEKSLCNIFDGMSICIEEKESIQQIEIDMSDNKQSQETGENENIFLEDEPMENLVTGNFVIKDLLASKPFAIGIIFILVGGIVAVYLFYNAGSPSKK